MELLLALRISLLMLLSTITFTCGQTDHFRTNPIPSSFARSISPSDFPANPREERNTDRRNVFFPPPDRLSPTLKPILSRPDAVVNPHPISNRPPTNKNKDENAEDQYYDEYYDEYYYDSENNTDGKKATENTKNPNTSSKVVAPTSIFPTSGLRFTQRPTVIETTRRPAILKDTTRSSQTFKETTRRPTTPPTTTRPQFRFRFTPPTDVRVTRPPIVQSAPSGTRKSLLADLIAQLENKAGNSEGPSSNDLYSDRQPKEFKFQPTSSSEKPPKDFKIRVTNSTESSFVIGSVESSQSMKMKDKMTPKSSQFSFAATGNPLKDQTDDYETTYYTDDYETTASTLPMEQGRSFSRWDAHSNQLNKQSDSHKPLTSLFGNIQIAVDPSLLPPGYSVDNITEDFDYESPTTTEKTGTTSLDTFSKSAVDSIFSSIAQEDVSSFLPAGFVSSSTEAAFKEEKESEKLNKALPEAQFVDPFAFLPPGFKAKADKPIISVKPVDPSSFLPPGFKPTAEDETDKIPGVVVANIDVSAFLPPGFKATPEASITEKEETIPGVKVKSVDVASFLPPGFAKVKPTPSAESTTNELTTSKVGQQGIVFPRRPNRPAFITTTTTNKPLAAGPERVKPKIVNVFDRVKELKNVEYTVPIVPEKPKDESELAEIKEEISTSTTTTTTTSTTTTTTTTTPPIPTTPGICGSKCRLAASLRLISGAKWTPELANRETSEFQQLANKVENELDSFFRRSSLSVWYDSVEIDSFYEGSVIVSYILNLLEIKEDIDTKDLKDKINTDLQIAANSLGEFSVDPKGADFIVIPEPQVYEQEDKENFLIPEWLIAVIVIGLASFLFILIFGVVALVSRARGRKRTNVPLTEEFLNNLNALQVNGIDNYAMNGLYDMDTMWNEKYPEKAMKPPSSKGKGYNPEYNVNIYDSWRTDYSGPDTSSSGNQSKRRPELDFDGKQFYDKDDPYDF